MQRFESVHELPPWTDACTVVKLNEQINNNLIIVIHTRPLFFCFVDILNLAHR